MTTRPTTPEVRLERLTGTIVEQSFDKAILPMGATEYHGPHLPYGTDTLSVEALAEAIARELGDTLVLPALDYGISHHHFDWKWTLSLQADTLALVIRDIGESLIHHGIRKLLVIPFHDANPGPAYVAARALYQKHGLEVAIMDNWYHPARQALAGRYDLDMDHGGEMEMSMVLYAAPETARPELAVNQPNQQLGQPIYLVGNYKGTVPTGFSGKAAEGTAQEGADAIEAIVDIVVPYLRNLDANGWKRGGWLSGIHE